MAFEDVDGTMVGVVPLHFNVEGHSIPLADFIDTARSVSGVIRSFNDEIFGGSLRYEIIVLPPQAGTFLSRLGVVVLGAGAVIFSALESDIGKAFVKGITGNEPAYYAEKVGLKVKDLIESFSSREEIHEKKVISDIIVDSARGFLSREYDDLRKSGITKDRFGEAYRSRNEFYQTCYRNADIKSIGFDETDHFPISRRDFSRYIIDVPNKEDEDDEADWNVEIVYIQVTSPNWDRRDGQRLWKARLHGDKLVTFSVDDERFWELVDSKSIPTKVRDVLKVQWIFVKDGEKRKSIRVVRVLEINSQKLSDPMPDSEIERIIGSTVRRAPREPDLFDS